METNKETKKTNIEDKRAKIIKHAIDLKLGYLREVDFLKDFTANDILIVAGIDENKIIEEKKKFNENILNLIRN